MKNQGKLYGLLFLTTLFLLMLLAGCTEPPQQLDEFSTLKIGELNAIEQMDSTYICYAMITDDAIILTDLNKNPIYKQKNYWQPYQIIILSAILTFFIIFIILIILAIVVD